VEKKLSWNAGVRIVQSNTMNITDGLISRLPSGSARLESWSHHLLQNQNQKDQMNHEMTIQVQVLAKTTLSEGKDSALAKVLTLLILL
jgi:hypothetical protein